jgi:hypothetical protein
MVLSNSQQKFRPHDEKRQNPEDRRQKQVLSAEQERVRGRVGTNPKLEYPPAKVLYGGQAECSKLAMQIGF